MVTIHFNQGEATGTDKWARVKFGERIRFVSPDHALELSFSDKAPFGPGRKTIQVPKGRKGTEENVVDEDEFSYAITITDKAKAALTGDARIIVKDSMALTSDPCEDLFDPDLIVTVTDCDISPEELEVNNGEIVLFKGPTGTQIEFQPPGPFKRCGHLITLPQACAVLNKGNSRRYEYSVVGCHGVGTARIIVKDAP